MWNKIQLLPEGKIKQINQKHGIALILCLMSSINVYSQTPLPPYGPVYPQNEVTTIHLLMDADDLQEMIDTQEDELYYTAQFIFQSSQLNDTIQEVGVRLRGNTSLDAAKKSFRISFNAFQSGIKWQEFEKINLLAQHNDPSLMRSKLCHDAYRSMGIPCARTSYTRLYINNEYRGIYLNQEHIDEEFVKKHFDQQGDGNLFKCTYPASLEYLGSNPNNYKFENSTGRAYDLKTNEWRDDYSDLVQFITQLNLTSLSNLPCELPQVINVDAYLKTAALDVLLGNWDGYIYNKNNYYLYHDQRSGIFHFIPYDLDNTWGIDWVDRDWGTRNIYNWASSGENRPLYKRLMQVPYYRQLYSNYIQQICNEFLTPSNINTLANHWQTLIQSAVQEDPYYSLDYNFSYSDFIQSVNQAWGEHVEYSIIDFTNTRANSALQQLESTTTSTPKPQWLQQATWVYQSQDIIHIESKIENNTSNHCTLQLSMDGNQWINTGDEFADDGQVWDIAHDQIYSYFTPNTFNSDKLYYQVTCDDEVFPCTPQWMWTSKSSLGIYINEVMSSNSQTLADENGNYGDWIELYNSNSWPINLNGKFLTDDVLDWNKFPLPPISISAGGYLLFWMDKEPEIGNQHGTFQLGGNDTDLYLFTIEQNKPRVADHFTPVVAPTDQSLSRIPDGGSTIVLTPNTTPLATNEAMNTNPQSHQRILAYPNPTTDFITWDATTVEAHLYNSQGQLVLQCKNCNQLSLAHLLPGTYWLQLDHTLQPVIRTRN